MGKISRFEVVFCKEDAVFHAGDVIEGFVYLDLNEDIKCRAVRIRCIGEGHSHVDDGSSSDDEWENYFQETVTVFGKQKGESGEDPILQGGTNYEWPFRFELPLRRLPSSFEYDSQYVRYMVKSFIDIPKRFDRSAKKFFTFIQRVDLNEERDAMKRQREQEQKQIGACCCVAGFMDLWMEIPQTGYVPGDAIVLKGEANNQSSREMKSTKVSIVQMVNIRARSKKKTKYRSIAEIKKVKYAPGETCVWDNQPMTIPPIPPSGLEGCSIIDIFYVLCVSASPAGPSFDLDLEFNLIIGSIPHREALAMMTMPMPPPLPMPAAPDNIKLEMMGQNAATAGPPTDLPPPAYPPPTYSDCVFGQVQASDKKEKDETTAYTPKYTFYNFS